MKYAILYYRPDNKFPEKVFGGVVRSVKNPQICSLDTFAYFHIARPSAQPVELREPYDLSPATDHDLTALETFYMDISGGLMLDTLDLKCHTGLDGGRLHPHPQGG